MHRRLAIILAAIFAIGLLAACGEVERDAQKKESDRRQGSYEQLSSNQPAESMSYSPTRNTINGWIETWDEPGKLSYVYLLASNGQLIGYYIFEGLPVSICTALTPNYDIRSHEYGNVVVPAPGVDGVYYGGGECSAYYGFDATTGSYIEYTIGNGISHLVFEEPMPRQDVEPLGFAIIGEVEDTSDESSP